MKYAFILLSSITICQADPSQATLNALRVPNAIKRPVIEKKIKKAKLPSGLLAAASKYDWGSATGKIPEAIDCKIVDLNSDGSPEYFTKTSMGGSGGPLYLIFTKIADTWRSIGEVGDFELLPMKNGWYGLVDFGHAGQVYYKCFYEYTNGRYQLVKKCKIIDGKVTKAQIEQVRSQNP